MHPTDQNKFPSKSVALLVISCDKYSDLWPVCATLLDHYWSDCPYDKFLMTNFKSEKFGGLETLQVGADKSWSSGLKNALGVLSANYKYVLTLVEDYSFAEKIDTAYLSEMISRFMSQEGDFLTLFKLPSRLVPVNEFYGELENFIPYRQSVAFTLWKIDTLQSILLDNESAWDFERIGVRRGFRYQKFYSSYRQFEVCNLIVKGKVDPAALKKVAHLIPKDLLRRPVMSRFESFTERIRGALINFFLFQCPSRVKRWLYFSLVR